MIEYLKTTEEEIEELFNKTIKHFPQLRQLILDARFYQQKQKKRIYEDR